ncbi:TraX protein [Clostridium tertium]|uniref:TraX protein n=1 Tax=Clostridium tertium TaxID=1559 RepID=A0A6N3BAD6_9CLOT
MNSTTLKLIALFLMFLDHIFAFIDGMPIWLTWLGRISAPIFMFTMVWGLYYTHDRKKYLLKIYYFNIIMAVGDVILAMAFPKSDKLLVNNIFNTLLLIGIVATIIDKYKNGEKMEGKKLLNKFWILQGISILITVVIVAMFHKIYNLALIPSAILPNILFCEGGPLWFVIGIMLYVFKDDKKKLMMYYPIFSAITFVFISGFSFTYENLFLINYQWMMILALPFMLIYNGEKGRGLKWLFYIFYPVHIFILFILGNYI